MKSALVTDLSVVRELRQLQRAYDCAMTENANLKREVAFLERLSRSMVRVFEKTKEPA